MSDDATHEGNTVYRFADYELDPAARTLTRDGVPVDVQGRAFDVIAYLLRQRERMVDKAELQDAVWPRQVITEAAMTRAVMKARKALDDDAANPRMIATLHARGYRFIAPVQALRRPASVPVELPVEGDETPAPGETPSAPAAQGGAGVGTSRKEWPWLPIGAVALLAAVVVLWLWRSEVAELGERPADEPARLAILPIEPAGEGEPAGWTRLGLVAGVADYLDAARAVETVPVRNVDRFMRTQQPPRETDADLAELARRFAITDGATHVVAGVIEPAADKLRLQYRIVDTRGVARARTLLDSSPTRLMQGLSTDLAAQFSGGRETRLADEDAFANEAYLRGKAAFLAGDYDGATTLLETALAEVPDALWPRLELAVIARNRRDFDTAERQLSELIQLARRAGDVAVEFNAVNSLGNLYLMSERIEQAEVRWREALVLAEDEDEPLWIGKATHNLAIAANIRQQRAEAQDWLRRSADAFTLAGFEVLPPQLAMKLADQHHIDGELDTAEHYTSQAIHGYRTLGVLNAEAMTVGNLGNLRVDQGRLDEAAALYLQAIEMLRRTERPERALGTQLGVLALLQAWRGEDAAAEAAFAEAEPLLAALPERIPLAALELRRARYLLDRGRIDEARRDLDAALGHYREGRLPYGEALTLAFMTKLHARAGELEAGRQRSVEALQAAEASGADEAKLEAADAELRLRSAAEGADRLVADWETFFQNCDRWLAGRPFLCLRRQLQAAGQVLAAGDPATASRWVAAVRARMPSAPGLEAAEAALRAIQPESPDRGPAAP